MTQAEIATIHRFMKKHGIKEFKHLFPVSGDAYDMTCPFMDDSKQKSAESIQSDRKSANSSSAPKKRNRSMDIGSSIAVLI